MKDQVNYTMNRVSAVDLIHRLSKCLSVHDGVVRVSLHTFDDGDINIEVDGLLAATLLRWRA
jgi:hypothetical protein